MTSSLLPGFRPLHAAINDELGSKLREPVADIYLYITFSVFFLKKYFTGNYFSTIQIVDFGVKNKKRKSDTVLI